MIIQKNRPNFCIKDFIFGLSSLIIDYKKRLEKEMCKLTSKNYCIYTSSGRSSLRLILKFIKESKIASIPLICETPLNEIVRKNKKIIFYDCDIKTFNSNLNSLEQIINKIDIIIIYHNAGNPEDIINIQKIIGNKNILLIEDCSQALGSKIKNKSVGSFGDISFFSFMKSSSGIGGGCITLNDYNLYKKIKKELEKYPKINIKTQIYLSFRILLEGYRHRFPFYYFYSIFKRLKKDYKKNKRKNTLNERYYMRPSNLMASLNYSQLKNKKIFIKRKNNLLKIKKGIMNLSYQSFNDYYIPSKFYLIIENAFEIIKKLNSSGIEARHLEFSDDIKIQNKFNSLIKNKSENLNKCKNYLSLKNKIVCIPLSSNFKKREIKYLIENIKNG